MLKTPVFVAAALVAGIANAHHGSTGQFDHEATIEITGVVKKIRFVNPHSYVYFDVTNDDGTVDEWRCEMRAASVLKRSGWSSDMFPPGTGIKIEGAPARREPHGCYVETFALDDGPEIERYQQLEAADQGDVEKAIRLADGTPNLGGNWAAPQRLVGNLSTAPGAAGRPPGPPPGRRGPGGRPRYEQSEAGVAASAGFEREDNPRFHCMATNIFMDWTFDQHVNMIEQRKESITLTYGFMDIVRTIHLNLDTHPDNIEPSRAGHSIGRWDGDTLIVDTIGFEAGYLDTRRGIKHSDQLHVVEQFSQSADGKILSRQYRGEDPLFLTEPFEGQDEIQLSAAAFDPYNCEDLTEEVVDGF